MDDIVVNLDIMCSILDINPFTPGITIGYVCRLVNGIVFDLNVVTAGCDGDIFFGCGITRMSVTGQGDIIAIYYHI